MRILIATGLISAAAAIGGCSDSGARGTEKRAEDRVAFLNDAIDKQAYDSKVQIDKLRGQLEESEKARLQMQVKLDYATRELMKAESQLSNLRTNLQPSTLPATTQPSTSRPTTSPSL